MLKDKYFKKQFMWFMDNIYHMFACSPQKQFPLHLIHIQFTTHGTLLLL
jgi:hypothetical protein